MVFDRGLILDVLNLERRKSKIRTMKKEMVVLLCFGEMWRGGGDYIEEGLVKRKLWTHLDASQPREDCGRMAKGLCCVHGLVPMTGGIALWGCLLRPLC